MDDTVTTDEHDPAAEQPALFAVDGPAAHDAATTLPDDDPDATDDLAAELDEPPTGLDDNAVHDDGDDPVYQGICHAGPYDGRPMSSRFPKGFLLVDRPGARRWTYDYRDGAFQCQPQPAVMPDRFAIADGDDYDVIAYDAAEAVAS